jgi:HD-GYP domain-containing protein (c-di-GMP phosphodiesterase class II)
MKKKIAIENLRVGMYVSDLDRSQLALPRGFWVRSQAQIDKLKRYCKHVYIDDSGPSVYPSSVRPGSGKWPPMPSFSTEQQKKLEFEMLKVSAAPQDTGAKYHDRTALDQEINTIRGSFEEAKVLMRMTMEGVRRGEAIDVAQVKNIVAQLVESTLRNANALVCLTQLRSKTDYTALHGLHTCVLALTFGRHRVMEVNDLYVLGIGALLHDIGMAKVPPELLSKPSGLSQNDFEIVKNHVRWGAEILRDTKGLPEGAVDVARYHHERYDGSGYLDGLKKNQIPLFGQIGGLVSCYDSMTSDRIYSKTNSAHAALKRIYEWHGKLFDAELVEKFIQCMGIYPIGSVVELNTGDVGVVITVNRVRRLRPRVRLALRPDRTPYRPPRTINLMQDMTGDGRPFEIDHVHEPGAYGINLIDYLPIRTRH